MEPAYDGNWNYDSSACAQLYLSGDGMLSAAGGDGDLIYGTYGGGAGIDGNGEDQTGGNCVDFGLICITTDFVGTIDAVGGKESQYLDGENAFGGGAGIGSGGFNMGYVNNYSDISPYYWGEVAGEIEIHNGQINAWSEGNGAGIGGGGGLGEDTASSNISITITNGTIFATGGVCGAGIGGGAICDGGTIYISSGQVTANAGNPEGPLCGAGIGGGDNGSVEKVMITDGAVCARASGGAAGIGGGSNTSYSPLYFGDMNGVISDDRVTTISISGETTAVTAYGGTGIRGSASYGGAGIGAGYPTANNERSVASIISITEGASVRSYGGYHAQAIGYGYRAGSGESYYTGYGITLVLDDSISLWAQNADYFQPALASETNYDKEPVAYLSQNRYLVHYIDENTQANSPGSDQVPGYLTQPSDQADESFSWTYYEENGVVDIGPVTRVDQVLNLAGNWATLCTLEPVTITPADIIVYVGGAGYESVVTRPDGIEMVSVSDGLPEPGFIMELPTELDQMLKTAAGEPLDEPLDLSDYLSFSYDDGTGVVRSWTLERYDQKEGNTSMAAGRYIYRIVPAQGQDPIRLQFYDEEGIPSISDDFAIELEDLYQEYEMVLYAGTLNPEYFQAEVRFPDGEIRKLDVESQSAKLTIRGVEDEGDPTTGILTEAPTEKVENITAQVSSDTRFYINESTLEVSTWDAVKLLTDHVVAEGKEILHQAALEEFQVLTQEYQVEFRYLDLVDTSNGNAWITASKPVTIYWPYPEGTTEETEFYLVHYTGLDRNDDEALGDGRYEMALYSEELGTLEKTPYGIKFEVTSFSPFVLLWKTDDLPVEPTEPTAPTAPVESSDPEISEDSDQPDISEDVPGTGDTAHTLLWTTMGLCALLVLGVLGSVWCRRNRNSK